MMKASKPTWFLGRRDRGRLFPEDTVFRTASVSKMVTAALVMKLAEEGKVDLDADADRALPYSLSIQGRRMCPSPFGCC